MGLYSIAITVCNNHCAIVPVGSMCRRIATINSKPTKTSAVPVSADINRIGAGPVISSSALNRKYRLALGSIWEPYKKIADTAKHIEPRDDVEYFGASQSGLLACICAKFPSVRCSPALDSQGRVRETPQ